MNDLLELAAEKAYAVSRWGWDFARQPDSPLHARELMYFLRTAAELPIELHRVGWSSIGLPRESQDTLAGHHHQVTLITKLVHMYLAKAGCKLNESRMIQMPAIHDLSEWGGGDAGVQRAKKDPEYKRHCRIIEAANRRKLALMLGQGHVANKYLDLAIEEMEQTTDEARIVKLCDGLEALLHLRRVRPRLFTESDDAYYEKSIYPQLNTIQDENIRTHLKTLVDAFVRLDKQGMLGQIPLTESDHELAPAEKMVRVWNELQMMKHVERTAWAVGGLEKHSMDTLAEHGHATTIGVWTVVAALEEHGMTIDMVEAISLALLQEAGKVFGGDVAIASTNATDDERVAAHYLRRGNFRVLFELLPDMLPELEALHEDGLVRKSDAAKLMMAMSRILDYLHYDLVHHPEYKSRYRHHTNDKILKLVCAISDPRIRTHLERLVKEMLMIVERRRLRRSVHSLIPGKSSYILK